MIIHFYAKGSIALGSSRQRAFFVADELRLKKWNTVMQKPVIEDISITRWPQKARIINNLFKGYFSIKAGDLIFVHKGIYSKYFILLLIFNKFFIKHKVIVDFDDAVFIHSAKKTKLLLKLANVAIGGSHYICDWLRMYHKNVVYIPTSIKYSVYSRFSKDYSIINEKLIIGWVGHGPMHFVSLRHIRPVFKKLIEFGVDFKFILVGALADKSLYELFDIKGMDVKLVDNLDWTNPKNVSSIISSFDIGIMPLEDIEIEKGKCAFKAIEYMACGVPTVASAVGENNILIQDGENGLLVKAWEEWPDALERLIKDPSLREKLGRAGQETIKKGYSFEVNIPKYEKIFNSLLDNG